MIKRILQYIQITIFIILLVLVIGMNNRVNIILGNQEILVDNFNVININQNITNSNVQILNENLITLNENLKLTI